MWRPIARAMIIEGHVNNRCKPLKTLSANAKNSCLNSIDLGSLSVWLYFPCLKPFFKPHWCMLFKLGFNHRRASASSRD